MVYLGAILCSIGIAFGQILFKLCANSYKEQGSILNTATCLYFFSATTFYALITVVWIYLLSKDDLGKLYPFMALAFIMVPIQSYFFLHEQFSWRYFLGITLIVIGIVLTLWRDKTWQ